MSNKSSTTLIGAFVVAAVVLATAGITILGGGKFLSKSKTYIMYFEGSLKGLSVGAPVVWRGVKIGQVADIHLQYDPEALKARIPVFVKVDQEKFYLPEGQVWKETDTDDLPMLIERGFGAQLQTQSFVTGQLQIAVDFYPDQKPRLSGTPSEYPEIPTIPTEFEKLKDIFTKLPIEEILNKLMDTLAGIDRIVNAPELMATLKDLELTVRDVRTLLQASSQWVDTIGADAHASLGDIQGLVRKTGSQIDLVAKNANSVLNDASKALRQSERTLALKDGRSAELADSLIGAADAFRDTLGKAGAAVDNIRAMTDADSEVKYQINTVLRELSAAARSIRIWAELIERQPEALIRGKGSRKN
ncbi:MAG: MlaD family protein [Thermodesulfobacteriota bacterium]|nr:MlaD family protein [Thermodesulfobacteriota bacterium]